MAVDCVERVCVDASRIFVIQAFVSDLEQRQKAGYSGIVGRQAIEGGDHSGPRRLLVGRAVARCLRGHEDKQHEAQGDQSAQRPRTARGSSATPKRRAM